MKKRMLALTAIALTLVLAFAGCGGTAASKAPSGSTAGESKAPAAGEPIKITMSSWANSGEIAVLQSAIDLFNESQTEIVVEFKSSPGEGYEQQLITSLAGGTATDVFYAGDSTISKLIDNGTVADLTDFMATEESYVKVEDFADGLWGAARKDGKIYGITVDCNPIILYYSPKTFAELGIEDPNTSLENGNWNMETFDAVLQKFVDNGKKGFVLAKEPVYTYGLIFANGGKVWQDGVYKFDEKALETMQWIQDNIKTGKIVYASALPKGQGAEASFMSGQVGFVEAGRWYTPMFNEANIDFDYVPFPNSIGEKYSPNFVATAYMAVNAKSPNLEAAKKFATFYCSIEGQSVRLGGIGNAIPSINGADNVVIESGVPAHVDHLFGVRDTGWANGGETVKDAQFPGLMDQLVAQLEEMYLNSKPVAEGAAEMERLAAEFAAKSA